MVLPVILVHGGAGGIPDSAVPDKIQGVRAAVQKGFEILSNGGTSLDAVQAAVEVMESDPVFNAGNLWFRNVIFNGCNGNI